MPTIIMTIKPRHLRNMESGIKRYELRKTVPRRTDGKPCRVLLNDIGLDRPPQSWQYVRVPYADIKID